ncbi:ABC transporter permease [Agromyces italicus]|uniref:ABC transporter permease n=1 Tax=Agromyces italicus TaxID=279572 RepID=UPI0003B712FF|nr:ABC transporter permease [Agromyces italicus]
MLDQLSTPSTSIVQVQNEKRPSLFSRMIRTPGIVVGAIGLFLIALLAFAVPPLAHLDPYAVDPMSRLQGSSAGHILGTDTFGRDLLARILSGAQTSLVVGFLVALVSGVFGTVIGVVAAFNSVLDQILMRFCDGLMAIPAILLAVALAAALGPSTTNLIIALTVVYTPYLARLVRSRAIAVKSEAFVEASLSGGARPWHVILRHVLPNTMSVIVVQSTFTFAESVIVEAALSFLGAGVPAPTASWGNILYDGKSVVASAPQMVVFTSLILVITILLLNVLGDGLRDLVDRRAQRHIAHFSIFGIGRKRRTAKKGGAA